MSNSPNRGGGRLTDDDRAAIERWANVGKNANWIAVKLGRHPATVAWHMYSAGLKAPGPSPKTPMSYVRNGRTVRRFTQDEDDFIESLRVAGESFRTIADQTNARFASERTAHSVQCRLIMLAARD